MSSYRPTYISSMYDDVPPPPPPDDLPPLPPGPPPPDSYRPMRDSWRPRSPPRADFSFRNPHAGPNYPRDADSYRPSSQQHARGGPRRPERYDDRRNLNPVRGFFRGRDRQGPRITSARPLLSRQHAEDALGQEVLGVTDGSARYMNVDEIASSEEADMEESNSESESGEIVNSTLDGTADDQPGERPRKRRDLGDGKVEHKWSNPDPYTVLPPTDDSIGKRKDPVETIRKYRKAEREMHSQSNQVTENDDFISFDFDKIAGSENGASRSDASSEPETSPRVPGAPKAPRSMRREAARSPEVRKADIVKGQSDSHSTTSDQGIAVRGNGVFNPPKTVVDNPISRMDRKRKRHDSDNDAISMGGSEFQIGLLPEWWPQEDTNPVPWLRDREHVPVNPGFRLHLEICDFYDFVRPQRSETIIREDLLRRLQEFVAKAFPRCAVYCFGSFAAGLFLPNADMDVVIMSEAYRNGYGGLVGQTKGQIFSFADTVRRSNLAKRGSVEVVASAKVPLVKFVDNVSMIRVDMSFENNSGMLAVDTFHKWKKQFPGMPVLVMLIKQFLLMRGLNEVQHGGLGGFTVTCLVTSLLQNMPRIQNGTVLPEEHLGEMLVEFLDLYGNRFDISRAGIQLEPPGYFDKHAFNRPRTHKPGAPKSFSDRLAIIDPNNEANDISGGSRNVMQIFGHFAKAHTKLLEAMKSSQRYSLLDWMLGGDYGEIVKQRKHLRDLYAREFHDDRPKSALTGHGIAISKRPPTKPVPVLRPRDSTKLSGPFDSTSEVSMTQRNRDRAKSLRERFPGVEDIPTEVTKEQKKQLTKKYETSRLLAAAEDGVRVAARKAKSLSLRSMFPEFVELIPDALDKQTFTHLSAELERRRAAGADLQAASSTSAGQHPQRSSFSQRDGALPNANTGAQGPSSRSLKQLAAISGNTLATPALSKGSSREDPIALE